MTNSCKCLIAFDFLELSASILLMAVLPTSIALSTSELLTALSIACFIVVAASSTFDFAATFSSSVAFEFRSISAFLACATLSISAFA